MRNTDLKRASAKMQKATLKYNEKVVIAFMNSK